MPNPVVSFEIRGPDPERLRRFYSEVFGWDMFVFPGGGYTGIETAAHTHDEASGNVTYTGDDAYMNEGVVLGSQGLQPVWKFAGERDWRSFLPGVAGGGIGEGAPSVSFYIQVPALEAALDAVAKGGGATVLPPTEVAPAIFIATFSDPAGNLIGLNLAPARG